MAAEQATERERFQVELSWHGAESARLAAEQAAESARLQAELSRIQARLSRQREDVIYASTSW